MFNKYLKRQTFWKLLVLCLCATHINIGWTQDIIEDSGSDLTQGDGNEVFSEKIKIISRSGKTFIMTNTNQLLSKGDFITLALDEKSPVARSVVAKNHNNLVGIKVLKIYSLARWSKLRKGLEVQIVKGDDSFLFKPKKVTEEEEEINKIESEEDLFNEKGIDEDLDSFYKDKRLIKPDNVVTAGWAQHRFKDTALSGDTVASNHWNFTWAYQFSDNYWLEGLYGRSQVEDIPAQGSQTVINNFTFRFKYTFKAPLYSYILPYIGFQTFSISSPDAGQGTSSTQNAKEEALISEIGQTKLAIGATLLRRLVPGWFLRVDLGSDIQAIGFGIEF